MQAGLSRIVSNLLNPACIAKRPMEIPTTTTPRHAGMEAFIPDRKCLFIDVPPKVIHTYQLLSTVDFNRMICNII